MSDSYTNLLYHIVFSTKDRRPLITPAYETQLYDYIGGIVRSVGGISLALNGTEDHLHLLTKLRPDRALSDVLRDLRANAIGWMHGVFPSLQNFSWQRLWSFYLEPVQRRRSANLHSSAEAASSKDFISRGIHSIPASEWSRIQRTIYLMGEPAEQ
jgi:REP element-mobilizing transposase RayT